ncbi:MAG: ribonuclease HII [Deferribacterota bacterium]|nr:ribonuclease HII [Deferribacterota bacterium]
MNLAGVDEVGRGALAGPVLACATILPTDFNSTLVIDSKKLSIKKREEAFNFLMKNVIDYGIGIVCPKIIDKINIHRATKQAMYIALNQLKQPYSLVVIDALLLSKLDVKNISINKAEDKYIQVAAASIIAKVTRDRLLDQLDRLFPNYGFNKNKGYGTKKHIEALRKYGPSIVHRKTYLKKLSFNNL